MKYSDWKAKSDRAALNEALKGKTVVFTFGRFQPPTSGHQKLVDALVSTASKAGGVALLYPSRTNDAKKNPLNPGLKVKWLRKFFGDKVKVMDDSGAKTMFDVMNKFQSEGVKKVIMVVGGDRVEEMRNAIKPYLTHKDPEKRYSFEFEVVSAGERDPDAEGVVGMSASKMRAAAAENNLSAFMGGIPSGVSKSDAESLFKELRRAMNVKEDTEYSPDELAEVGMLEYSNGSTVQFWLDEQDGVFYAVETDEQGNASEGGYGTLETMLKMYPMAWATFKPYLNEYEYNIYRQRSHARRVHHDELGDSYSVTVTDGEVVTGWRNPGTNTFYPMTKGGVPSTTTVTVVSESVLKPWMLDIQKQKLQEIVAFPWEIGKAMQANISMGIPCAKRQLPMKVLTDAGVMKPIIAEFDRKIADNEKWAKDTTNPTETKMVISAAKDISNMIKKAFSSKKESAWKSLQVLVCKPKGKDMEQAVSWLSIEMKALLIGGSV